jgi:hypothetical protein
MTVTPKSISLREARSIATRAREQLSGLLGDPAKLASWIRERQLAEIVIQLLDRVEDIGAPLQIETTRDLQRDHFDQTRGTK